MKQIFNADNKRRLRWIACASVCAWMLTFGGAEANADETTAQEAFRRGVKHLSNGDYAACIEDFEASYREFQNQNSLSNLALCYFKLSRFVESLKTLKRLEEEFRYDLTIQQMKRTQARIEEIETMLPSIRIATDPGGAAVTIDNEPIGETPILEPVFLAVGEHSIAIHKNGFETIYWNGTFDAAAREEKSFILEAATAPSPRSQSVLVEPIPTVSVREVPAMPQDKSEKKRRTPLFITGLSGTVVTAVASIGFWAAGGHFYRDYEEKNSRLKELDDAGKWDDSLAVERDDTERLTNVFNTAAVVTTSLTGAFLVVTAAAAIWNRKKERESTVSTVAGGLRVRF